MKILLLTSNGYGHKLLPALRALGHEVTIGVADEPSLAVTTHGKDIVAFAREQGADVHVIDPERGKAGATVRAAKPDLVINAGYLGSLLPNNVTQARHGGFTLHPALLPRFQGLSPENWVIIEGGTETGVTAVVPKGRTIYGEILTKKSVPVLADDDHVTLADRLADAMVAMVVEQIAAAEKGPLSGEPIEGGDVTHLPPVRPRDGIISFNEPNQTILNRIRGTVAYPGAYALLDGKQVRIKKAHATKKAGLEVGAGLVLKAAGTEVTVQTKDGNVVLELDEADVRAVAATPGAMFTHAGYEVPVRTATPTDHEAEEFGIPKEAEDFPTMVVLSVAYPCNALCPNCPYTPGNSTIREWYNDQPFVPKELFQKIARECGEYNSFLRITGGGEPFLHPDGMTDLIEYAKSVKSRVWCNTNGSLLYPELGERLVACQTDMVEFSVDAMDKETYKVVRAGLDWDQLLVNVRGIVNARNRTKSTTRIVVSVINQDVPGVQGRMDEIAAFWTNEIGVDEVIRRKFLTWGSNTSLDAIHSADSTGYLDKGQGVPCPFPFHRLNVDSRGKIEVCGYDISGRTNFGNVTHQRIKDIWKGPEFTWWRKMHLERRGGEIPMCRECPDWRYRSWKHNWTKVLAKAEAKRLRVIGQGSSTATEAPPVITEHDDDDVKKY